MDELTNECNVKTIFPMGVTCVVTDPTTIYGSDGIAQLVITGGTPPYNISWDNGNATPIITNLSVGSYGASITDYYGDFSARTTCVLVGPATTTSTSTTTTTTLPIYDFCMVIDAIEYVKVH